MEEIWKNVPGYENLYRVSNMGRFFGVKSNRILCPGKSGCGYLQVQLCKRGIIEIVRLHKLVMTTFVGPYPKGMEINHINSIKTDNRLANLEYCTHSHNIKHRDASGVMDGKYGSARKGKLGILNHNSKKLAQMDLEGNTIKVWNSLSDVGRDLGISISLISGVTKGKGHTAGGFKRKYL